MAIDSGDASEIKGNKAESRSDSENASESNENKEKDRWRELREGKFKFKDGSIGKFGK